MIKPSLLCSLLLIGLFGACGENESTTGAKLSGDTCAAHVDQAGCVADSGCSWVALGRPCPDDGTYCQSGVCFDPSQTGSGSSGSGGTGTACACPNGGVCYEQIGGPAQTTDPQIECATPEPGDGDPCSRIQGQGTCQPSPNVGGLCICDNGVR